MRPPYAPLSIAMAAVWVAGCQSELPDARTGAPAAALDAPAAASSIELDAAAGSAARASIEWFRGDVDAAFASARTDDKPVLLYWGAEWCPYCADLEAHVFSREDVRRKLELFVPVYLDGDDPGAQRWGDIFGVAGYPTVLALAPERTELARIAGGMDLTRYAEMLDLVLADVRPIDDILAASRAETLSAEDCRRLAYNGWPLGDAASAQAGHLAADLAAAAEQCAAPVERARLIGYATAFALSAESDEGQTAVTETLLARTREILADRALATSIADVLLGLGDDYFAAVKAREPHSVDGLLNDWIAVMDAASNDSRYDQGVQLAAVRSKIEAVAALAPQGIPSAMVIDARRRIDAAFNDVGRSAARAGTANAAINLLVALGDLERAREIAQHELEHSPTPYYHMADLAWIDEMLGEHADAVDWLEQAYRASTGPATRFQWGTNYVRGLIRMTPDDETAIRAAVLDVLGELEGAERIYRRSRGRLETLDAALRDWNASGEHAEVLAAARARIAPICAEIPAAEADARAACSAFLSGSP